MSTETQALALAIKIGQDVKELKDSIGDTTQLTTNAQTLDGAINELQQELNALNSGTTIIQ